MNNKRFMMLVMMILGLLSSAVLVSDSVSAMSMASGTISATPQLVIIPTGSNSGSSTICWSVSGASTGEVWVSSNGGTEQLFARARSGCQVASWIQPNRSYQFTLYEGTAHSVALGSTSVIGLQKCHWC